MEHIVSNSIKYNSIMANKIPKRNSLKTIKQKKDSKNENITQVISKRINNQTKMILYLLDIKMVLFILVKFMKICIMVKAE